MLLYQSPRQIIGTYQRAVVSCANCQSPIYLRKFAALADEFSVNCPRCGHRKVYAKSRINVESLPERRRKPRR